MKLKLKNITHSFDNTIILNNISLSLSQGKLFSLLGASGCGKTTLLKIIVGILEQNSGEIFLEEKEISSTPIHKRCIGYIAQKPLLFPHLNVKDNIAFGLRISGETKAEIDNRVNELLKTLQLSELAYRMPSELSGGQQQRVSLARAIVLKPSILLMDEPFSALDASLRKEMGEILNLLKKKYNLTILFITHDIQEAMTISDEIGILMNKRIVQVGKPKDVYYHPINEEVANFLGEGSYIEGVVKNNVFENKFLNIHVNNYKDGNYKLFLRPNQVFVNKSGLKANIIKKQTIGFYTRLYIEHCTLNLILDLYQNIKINTNTIQVDFNLDNPHLIEQNII